MYASVMSDDEEEARVRRSVSSVNSDEEEKQRPEVARTVKETISEEDALKYELYDEPYKLIRKARQYLHLLDRKCIDYKRHFLTCKFTMTANDFRQRNKFLHFLDRIRAQPNLEDLWEDSNEESDGDRRKRSKAKNSTDKDEKPKFVLSDKHIHTLLGRYEQMYEDSIYMLHQSKQNERISLGCKLTICAFGLVTSYVSAISGVSEAAKVYTTATLGLCSALTSGWQSIFNASTIASKLYSGYVAYQDLCSELEMCFLTFESPRTYEEIVDTIQKVTSKYDGTFTKHVHESVQDYQKKVHDIKKKIEEKVRENNDGSLPAWWPVVETVAVEEEAEDDVEQTQEAQEEENAEASEDVQV